MQISGIDLQIESVVGTNFGAIGIQKQQYFCYYREIIPQYADSRIWYANRLCGMLRLFSFQRKFGRGTRAIPIPNYQPENTTKGVYLGTKCVKNRFFWGGGGFANPSGNNSSIHMDKSFNSYQLQVDTEKHFERE